MKIKIFKNRGSWHVARYQFDKHFLTHYIDWQKKDIPTWKEAIEYALWRAGLSQGR